VKENVCDLVSLFLCCCRFSVDKGYVKGIEREMKGKENEGIERGKGIRGREKQKFRAVVIFFLGNLLLLLSYLCSG